LLNRAGTAVVTKTTASGISITNATGGVFVVTIDKEDTEDLEGVYAHEAVITDSAGDISTVTTLENDYGRVHIRNQLVAP
jgi:hypothetical protein